MDATAAIELVRRHAGLIHRVARTFHADPTDREDVTQEIAIELWRSHHRYDPAFRESTWVYRIALNVAISFGRRERRHRERRQPTDEPLITVAAPADDDAAEDVRRLHRCIAALAPLDRALVLLHLDGNDHATIADVLGISVSNVGTKLARIKERLRAALARAMTEDGARATR